MLLNREPIEINQVIKPERRNTITVESVYTDTQGADDFNTLNPSIERAKNFW